MKEKRHGLIKLAGQDVTVIGEDLVVGQTAPEFKAIATDWSVVDVLASTAGKVRILGSLPSLSTGVCDRETRRFNQEAIGLSDDIMVILVSMDLPWTQKNWCGSAGIERVQTLSDHRYADFGPKYGVLIEEQAVLRRAIFVIDRQDKVVYAAYMPVLGDEPDYDQVIAAANAALNG
jgi:thiol peroxidase